MPSAMPVNPSRPAGVRPAEVRSGRDIVALADRCVQCGLCLPACPTYGHDRIEAESPRGRIALMRAWALDTIEPTATGDRHLDDCLACRSCEAVCPAGVEYGALLVAARGVQRERRGAGWGQRAIEAIAARPSLLRTAFAFYRWCSPVIPRGWRPLPAPPPRLPARTASASTAEQTTAALFVGCVADTYEAPARSALARLCDAAGVALVIPPEQTCCGALHAHGGNLRQAGELAARNSEAFSDRTTVLTLASGCHEAVAGAVGSAAVDALQFLDGHRDRLVFARCDARIALHLPCTQRNVVRSVPALRRLLAAVPGLEVIELDAGYGCCGAAGTSFLLDRARADDYRRPLVEQLAASGATRLLSANIGCRLHLAGGSEVPVQHPLEFLAGLIR